MLNRRTFLAAGAALAVPVVARSAPVERIVLIHGRAQGARDQAEILSEWTSALKAGFAAAGHTLPKSLEIVLPFYGAVLDALTEQYDLPLVHEITTKGDALQERYLTFQEEVADDLRTKAGITDAEVDAIYGDNPRPKGPENWEWVQALIRAIDRWGGGTSQFAIEHLLRDVFLYTTALSIRQSVNEVVRAAFDDRPAVVVAHSLGTVVAYDIMREAAGPEVPLLVTLGSPLGIRAIRREVSPVLHPSVVERWLNGYDERDVVALFPLDVDNFDVTPGIENIGDLRNQTDNRHVISGYLDKPGIAGPVAATVLYSQ
jgi:hypothetical protein